MILKKYRNLVFELNPSDLTAKVIRSPAASGIIMIPRSIFHESQEFIVKSIGKKSFKGSFTINSIDFPEDSEVKIIEEQAFFCNELTTINLPSSIEFLEDNWCQSTFHIINISISPYNKNFKYLNEENKVIIGKSNLSSNDFDVLVFASRDISQIRIPSYIKYISPYCFEGCMKLQTVEFEDNSELISIGREAFRCTKINSFFIPSKVKELMQGCLDVYIYNCKGLTSISISPENPNFKYLDNEKKIIVGKTDPNNDIFDVIVRSCNDVSISVIPSHIKRIDYCAFSNCYNLKNIKFEENSQIEHIGKFAFVGSSLENISIPSNVKIIEGSAFQRCDKLKTVFIPDDSKLHSFSEKLFFDSGIETISIPPNIEDSGKYFCSITSEKTKILISPQNRFFKYLDKSRQIVIKKSDNNSNEFDSIIWASPKIRNAYIPFYIKHICPYAFHKCLELESVIFDKNSQLISIQKEAFSDCWNLKEIAIPSHVKIIGKKAFFRCEKLRFANCQENSELISIGSDAFLQTALVFVDMPRHVQKMEINNFRALDIKLLRLTNNSELRSIGYRAFYGCTIQAFPIPSNFQFFDDGWCKNTPYLRLVVISPENKNFKYLDNEKKLIVSKSDLNKDSFDVLEFASRDITTAFIPSNIKYIRSNCFEKCKNLKNIQFEQNSQLISIGNEAFQGAEIESFHMPPNVKEINDHTFSQCSLKNIEFDDNSELKSICQGSFSYGKIETISIPDSITEILYCAFYMCKNLKKLNITENSHLKFIDTEVFHNSSIESICIPSSVDELKDGWCHSTPNLIDVELSPNNKSYKYLDKDRKMIIGKSNKNSEDFDILVFACRDITQAFIPSYIKHICPYCFQDCRKLTKVEFDKNSLLASIGTAAFYSSLQIQSILIPSHVKRIEKECFENCINLMNLEFEENSELMLIGRNAFNETKINEKSIPSNVKVEKT